MKVMSLIFVSILSLLFIILDCDLVCSYISSFNVDSAIDNVSLGVVLALLVTASWLPIYGLIKDLKD